MFYTWRQKSSSHTSCHLTFIWWASQIHLLIKLFIVIQLLSYVQLFATPRTVAHQAPLSSTISQSLLKLMSTESVMLSNYPILYSPLLLKFSIFPSIRVFSNELYLRVTEKAMTPHSSTLALKIPWTEEPGRLQSMGSQRVGFDWVTWLSLFSFMH